jgi:hypothetical protein
LRCRIVADGKTAGRIHDFILDDDSWTVRYFEVQTRPLAGRHVLLAAGWAPGVNWSRRTIALDAPADVLKSAPVFDGMALRMRGYGPRLMDHLSGGGGARMPKPFIGGRLR